MDFVGLIAPARLQRFCRARHHASCQGRCVAACRVAQFEGVCRLVESATSARHRAGDDGGARSMPCDQGGDWRSLALREGDDLCTTIQGARSVMSGGTVEADMRAEFSSSRQKASSRSTTGTLVFDGVYRGENRPRARVSSGGKPERSLCFHA